MKRKEFEESRNIWMDFLRGLAALSVVLFHYTARYPALFCGSETVYPIVFAHGSYAVLTFFVMSGYWGFREIQKSTAKTYSVKRFFSLYPVYWICICISMFFTSMFLKSRAVSISDMFVDFTMLQDVFGFEHVDGAYWTLICDLSFYVLIFLLLLFHLSKHTKLVVCLFTAFELLMSFELFDNGIYSALMKINSRLYVHCFICGGCLAEIEHGTSRDGIAMGFCAFLCMIPQFVLHGFESGMYMLCDVLLIMFALKVNGKFECPIWLSYFITPICFLAGISFPLYLLHQNIGYIIINMLRKSGLYSELYLVIPIALVILLAYGVDRFIGRPVVKIKKHCLEALNDN